MPEDRADIWTVCHHKYAEFQAEIPLLWNILFQAYDIDVRLITGIVFVNRLIVNLF